MTQENQLNKMFIHTDVTDRVAFHLSTWETLQRHHASLVADI